MTVRTDLQTATGSDAPNGSWRVPVRVDYAPSVKHLRIGRYRLLEVIGEGAMGRVWLAEDADLDRQVAIKLVRGCSTEQARARMLREARALAKFDHPNVVPVYDVGIEDEVMFVVMAYLPGVTLRTWLRCAPRAWVEIAEIFLQAAHGLAAVHRLGLGHRDFKPDNLVITDDGRVKLVDFGLAKSFRDDPEADPLATSSGEAAEVSSHSETITKSGTLVGTPAYMAPEQYRQRAVDGRADQFSFCVALWEALFGQRPFRALKTSQLAVRICRGIIETPPRAVCLSPALERLLRRGLAPVRGDRFTSMAELATELERILERAERG